MTLKIFKCIVFFGNERSKKNFEKRDSILFIHEKSIVISDFVVEFSMTEFNMTEFSMIEFSKTEFSKAEFTMMITTDFGVYASENYMSSSQAKNVLLFQQFFFI